MRIRARSQNSTARKSRPRSAVDRGEAITRSRGKNGKEKSRRETGDRADGQGRPKTRAPRKGKTAIVDARDFERLSAFNWLAVTSAGHRCGAMRSDGSNVRLEREILGKHGTAGKFSFANGDRFDFRRANLRYREPQPRSSSGFQAKLCALDVERAVQSFCSRRIQTCG